MIKKQSIEFTFIIGIIIATIVLYYGVGFSDLKLLFWNTKSILIVLGGTISATFLNCPNIHFKKLLSRLSVAFSFNSPQTLEKDILYLATISKNIKINRSETLNSTIKNSSDPFLTNAFQHCLNVQSSVVQQAYFKTVRTQTSSTVSTHRKCPEKL